MPCIIANINSETTIGNLPSSFFSSPRLATRRSFSLAIAPSNVATQPRATIASRWDH